MTNVAELVFWEWEDKYPGRKIFGSTDKAIISGRIEYEFMYDHTLKSERFFTTTISVERSSGIADLIPIIVSEKMIKKDFRNQSVKGKYIQAAGQFRSFTSCEHLRLYLFATVIKIYDEEEEMEESNTNLVYLEGTICKTPKYRVTPLGREITEILLAVNRDYYKSDYIPCIAWSEDARFASNRQVGDRIIIYGRIQSRTYVKKDPEIPGAFEKKNAYEVSVMRLYKKNLS